jgi:hypothetical protein
MYAAQACDLPLVSFLLERNANVPELDGKQQSTLHWCTSTQGPSTPAAQDAYEQLLKLLIQKGLKVRANARVHSSQ